MKNKPVNLDVLGSDVLEDKDIFKQPSVDKKHYGVRVKGDASPILDSDIFAERDKYKPQTIDNKRYATEIKNDVSAVQGVDPDGDGKPKEIIGASSEGGTTVKVNPGLTGDEPELSGLEVDGEKFKIPEGKVYTAGNGIAISEDGIISLDIAVADKETF